MGFVCHGYRHSLKDGLEQLQTSLSSTETEESKALISDLQPLPCSKDSESTCQYFFDHIPGLSSPKSAHEDTENNAVCSVMLREVGRQQSVLDSAVRETEPQTLVLSQGTGVVYSLRKGVSRHWTHTEYLDRNLRFSSIATDFPRNCIYVTGGQKARLTTDSCIELNYVSHTWKEIARLNKPRQLHGAFYTDGSLIVFGGNDHLCEAGMNSAEELLIHTTEPFRTMSSRMKYGRRSINPCRNRQDIYLPLGGHASIEVYSIVTHQFRCLTVELPEQDCCLSVVDGEALILVTNVRRYRVNLGTGAMEEPISHSPLSNVKTNSVSLLYEGSIYAIIGEAVWVIAPETGELKQKDIPSSTHNNNWHITVPGTQASVAL